MSLFMVFDGKIGAPTPDFDRLPSAGVWRTPCAKRRPCAAGLRALRLSV
jgi:hypothetical protein